jgi:hypothetical protein
VSRNYKIHEQEDLHYLTHATVGWVDILWATGDVEAGEHLG